MHGMKEGSFALASPVALVQGVVVFRCWQSRALTRIGRPAGVVSSSLSSSFSSSPSEVGGVGKVMMFAVSPAVMRRRFGAGRLRL